MMEVGPVPEADVRRAGLLALQTLLGDLGILSFAQRASGVPLLLRQGFFERLLRREVDLASCPAADLLATQSELQHLSLPQLLKIRCDCIDCNASAPSQVNFLSYVDEGIDQHILAKLSVSNGTTSRTQVSKASEIVHVVLLIYGVYLEVDGGKHASTHWLLRVASFVAILDLEKCELSATDRVHCPIYCHTSLCRGRAATPKGKRHLHWHVELSCNPSSVPARLVSKRPCGPSAHTKRQLRNLPFDVLDMSPPHASCGDLMVFSDSSFHADSDNMNPEIRATRHCQPQVQTLAPAISNEACLIEEVPEAIDSLQNLPAANASKNRHLEVAFTEKVSDIISTCSNSMQALRAENQSKCMLLEGVENVPCSYGLDFLTPRSGSDSPHPKECVHVMNKCQVGSLVDTLANYVSYTEARSETVQTCASSMCDRTVSEIHVQSRHHLHAQADDENLHEFVFVEELHKTIMTTHGFHAECQSQSASMEAAEVCNHYGSSDHPSTSTESAPSGSDNIGLEKHPESECQTQAQTLFAGTASSADPKVKACLTMQDCPCPLQDAPFVYPRSLPSEFVQACAPSASCTVTAACSESSPSLGNGKSAAEEMSVKSNCFPQVQQAGYCERQSSLLVLEVGAALGATDSTLPSTVCAEAALCGGSGTQVTNESWQSISDSLSYIARLESELQLMQVKLMSSEKAREELTSRLTQDQARIFGVYDISGGDCTGPTADLDEHYMFKKTMHLWDCSQDSRQRARGKTKSSHKLSRLFRIPLPFNRFRKKSQTAFGRDVSARSPGQ